MSDTTTTDGLGEIALVDGPWEYSNAPQDAAFIDFGPLKLPAIPGIKIRVEFDHKTHRIGAVSVKVNDAEVQLQVVAAPRGQEYWTTLRQQMLHNFRKRPGDQQAIEGRFGPEIIASLTGRRSDGILADTTMRALGVNGDRWVLRAVVSGAAVTSDATVERVNALLSHCAVERGSAAIGAGTVLELTAPPGQPASADIPDDGPEAPAQ